jgi:ATP-dependent Clp protease adaptor protein ClpS
LSSEKRRAGWRRGQWRASAAVEDSAGGQHLSAANQDRARAKRRNRRALALSKRHYPAAGVLAVFEGYAMSKTVVAPRTKTRTKTQRPPLYKVILLNDDYTPREFVVLVLKAVFRMNADQAYRVMMTAHQRGACVIAVYTRDVAETKAKEATELGKSKGYPLFFTTEPEE